MASIRKRHGKWQVQVRRGDHRGISRTFLTRQDADKWARQQEQQVDRTGLPEDRRVLRSVRLADLLERYRSEVTVRKKSARQERYRIGCLLADSISSICVNDLRASHMADYRDSRLQTVGPQAVLHELNLIDHLWRIAAAEWGLPLSQSPVAKIKKPRPSHARERRLTGEEADRLEEAARGPDAPQYLLHLLWLALETGMRKGEILTFRRSDIDCSRRVALLRNTKNGHPRSVPLSSTALDAVLSQPESDDDLVFPVSVPALRFHWEKLCNESGIEDLHFHDLRHEAISRLFERGLSVPEAALISGHRDVRQLLRYTHPRASDIAIKLDELPTVPPRR